MAKRKYTPEETAEYNKRKKAEIDEMIKRIDEGVKAYFESDKYKEYLKFASKFTDYSARNTLLINMQRPDATLVAAYGKWQQLGRYVEQGETGIEILAPVTYKTNLVEEIDRPAVDEFGNKLYNEDGTEKIETVEKPMTGLAFKKIYVFDVSQTSGKEIPEFTSELQGDIDSARKEAVFAALKSVTGVDIEFKNIIGGAKGYYSYKDNKIVIKSEMSDAQTLKTAFHEAAHCLLHDPNKNIVTNKSPRNEKEVQAESVAFMVSEKFGIDTSEYSFPYIASWSDGKQAEQLKRALQEIQETAKRITKAVESELLKLQKRSLTMEEKLADTELNSVQKAEFLIEDCSDRGVIFSQEDTEKILEYAEKSEDINEVVQFVSDMERMQKQRDSYGYDFTYMTPIDTKEEAIEAYDRGEAVYLLYPDNTEGRAESRSEIENFEGYFGIEKDPSRDVAAEQNSELIPVSKEVALEMWDKDLDVYIDGVRAENREEIENAADDKKLYLSEFQYSAQLEFENPTKVENTEKKDNIIGNTSYSELGNKSELQYYNNLKNRHAENVARVLDESGIKYSGIKRKWTTTITINKADIPAFEAALKKVKDGYEQNKSEDIPMDKGSHTKDISAEENTVNTNIIGNTPYSELGDKSELQYYRNLKNRHAENVAKALDENGIKYSGMKKGTFTTITINKADIPKYETVVEQVKAGYEKHREASTVKSKPKKSESIAAAIDSAISQNNYKLYHYDLKKAADSVITEFGAERVEKVLADYINRHDYDGRISPDNKKWAKGFEPPQERYEPVFKTHPCVLEGFINDVRSKIKELEIKSALPSIYDDKFLYSSERAELRDDYRGIPETHYFNSSANEYFVDGIGWLDNSAYDHEQKMSGLSSKDFYAKVTHINSDYIDTDGKIGQIDMSKSDYNLMTEKTYSPENTEKLEAAKAEMYKRINEAGITEKPTELYAVRQASERKFTICTISADGLVTPVNPNIASVAEAKKAMLELYESRKDFAKCELVHPQTLDEKSAELYKNQEKELPSAVYRIMLNTDKKSEDTHILQEYIKHQNDTYKLGKVVVSGDFYKCNAALKNILAKPIRKEPEQTFDIYQIKGGEETRYIRFEPYENLVSAGEKPDFNNYAKIYTGSVSDLKGSSISEKLESAFEKFNVDRPKDFTGHSLSVSDVVVMNDTPYYVDTVGFRKLNDFMPLEVRQERFIENLTDRLNAADYAAEPEHELAEIADEALKLNIPTEIMNEACLMSDNDRAENLARTYEKAIESKEPFIKEPEKTKPQKKPKL